MAKRLNLNATKSGEEKTMERYLAIIKTGEELGIELIGKLCHYGSSTEGLAIETYALCKAWAALMVIAEDEGFAYEVICKNMMPSFIEEMREFLKEANGDNANS